MAEQGELRIATEREKYKVPYYDSGDIRTVEGRVYVRVSPDGSNVYELPVFPQRITSYPRFGVVKDSGQDTDFSFNNDKDLVFYDSIFFERSDVVWQNIRKDRYGNNVFYNREQQSMPNAHISFDGDMKWISPWAVWGVGEYDFRPGYMVMYPTDHDFIAVWEEGEVDYADYGDDFYKADINRVGSYAAIGWYDDSLGRETVSTVEYADVDGNWWTDVSNEVTALSFGRAPNIQRYEEVSLPADTWVNLNNSNLSKETVSVDPKVTLNYEYDEPYIEDRENQGFRGYRYESGVDYEIDHTNGKIKNLGQDIPDGETCYANYEYGDTVKIYAGTTGNEILQINAGDGNIDWTVSVSDAVEILEGGSDGVYVNVENSSDISKYDRSGNSVWVNSYGSAEVEGFELDNGENYLYFSDKNGYVRKIDLSDQSIVWQTQFSEYVGKPALDYDDSFLYIPEHTDGSGSCIHEVDISNGNIIRSYCGIAPDTNIYNAPQNLNIPPVGDPENPLDFVNKL